MFDHVFYINLDHSVQRRKVIEKQLNEAQLSDKTTRIEAIYGPILDQSYVEQETESVCGKFCTRRLIGCALSHIKCWETLLASEYESVLILEDDALILRNDIEEYLKSINTFIPPDWDVLYLGCFMGCSESSNNNLLPKMIAAVNGKYRKNTEVVNEHIIRPSLALGNHGYIINRKGAQTLLENIKYKISDHVDIQMNTVYHSANMNAYALKKPIIVQQTNLSVSNIASYQFPVLINKVLDGIEDSDGQSLGYKMNISVYETAPSSSMWSFPINFWVVIFLLIGVVLAKLNVKLQTVTFIYLFIFGLDFLTTNGNIKIAYYAVIYYILLTLPRWFISQ